MLLLLDIGNTNTHIGLANARRVVKQTNFPTQAWFNGLAKNHLAKFLKTRSLSRSGEWEGAMLCSVVPRATLKASKTLNQLRRTETIELTPATLRGVGIDY